MRIKIDRAAKLETRLLSASMGFGFREVELPGISI
jgi:hypothetical protein